MFIFNGTTKEITGDYTLTSGKATVSAMADLYSSWKEWIIQGDNAKYLSAFSTTGGDDLGEGLKIGAYFFLENGWKIRPLNTAHRLVINGNLQSRDNTNPFLPTTDSFNVLVEMKNSSLTQTLGGSISRDDLDIINRGVQKASILVPHFEDLP